MICGYPVTLIKGKLNVPCGKCMNCRITRQKTWMGRMLLEEKHAKSPSAFLTLTLDEDSVSNSHTLVPRDFTQWIDRLRKRKDVGNVRFFGCGEYGSQTGRPHYHTILFGIPPEYWEAKLHNTWKLGFVAARPCNIARIRYISNYVTKRMTTKDDIRLDGRHPEFARASRNPPLGFKGLESIRDRLLQNKDLLGYRKIPGTFRIGGKVYPIGPYWKKWLMEETGWVEVDEQLEISEDEQKKATQISDKERLLHDRREKAYGRTQAV